MTNKRQRRQQARQAPTRSPSTANTLSVCGVGKKPNFWLLRADAIAKQPAPPTPTPIGAHGDAPSHLLRIAPNSSMNTFTWSTGVGHGKQRGEPPTAMALTNRICFQARARHKEHHRRNRHNHDSRGGAHIRLRYTRKPATTHNHTKRNQAVRKALHLVAPRIQPGCCIQNHTQLHRLAGLHRAIRERALGAKHSVAHRQHRHQQQTSCP